MNREISRRRSPPVVVPLVLVIITLVVLIGISLGWLAWQRAGQIQVLEAQMDRLRSERQATESQLRALEGTAAAMESRLAALEANDPAQQLAALQAAVETANDPQQIVDLQASLVELQGRIDRFQATLDDVAARLDAMDSTGNTANETLPPEVDLLIAPLRQTHNLSCESAAAAMVAQYQGVQLTEVEVLAALPKLANPHLGFRGNVDGPTGGIADYGVYAGPILAILNDQGLQARLVEDGLAGIKAAVARGNPVIAWVTYNCLPSTPTEVNIDGQTVTLVPNQHVVVVTGYNAEGIWANDPWDGQHDFYPTADFIRAMGYFDDMAIEIGAP
jgi:uncharacterized protein YvpB/cell division protein FtsB